MKVLHLITRLDRGGSAKIFLNLIKALKADGIEVIMASGRSVLPEKDPEVFSRENKVKFYLGPNLVRDINPIKDIKAFFEILFLLRSEKPDVLHTHTSKTGFLGRIAGKLSSIKAVVHTPHGHIFYGYFNRVLSYIFLLLERLATIFTDKIIALTERERQEYIRLRIADGEKIQTVHNGIYIERFLSVSDKKKVREELGIKPYLALIGWVGRLVDVKGCEYFIDAAGIIKTRFWDSVFIIAGDGPLRDFLERKAEAIGISESVYFLGYRTDIPDIIALIDILVISSLNEGLGLVAIEAMASARPVVATNVGGLPEVIIDGKCGFIVPPGNPQPIADAVLKILTNHSLKEKMGIEARERAQIFDFKNTVKETIPLYKGLL
ncbi:MAG: glycosyltransferase family 4 protein [Nitrospirota bacterium]